jgi:DNA-directed RNA polymerase specialized sigma subunit
MDYIRYNEAELLYKHYNIMKAILDSFHINFKEMQEQQNIDDDIYSESMGNHGEGSTLPPEGQVSDKTGNLALRYMISAKQTQKEVKKDILKLSAVIDQISIGINSLSKLQRIVLELYYWESKTWKQVSESLKEDNFYRNKDQCMHERKHGIQKIRDISKVPMDSYLWIMEMINIEDKEA